MPAGRPLKFESVEDLEQRIQEYFAKCDKWINRTTIYKGEPIEYIASVPYTISWLASYLWTNRQTLVNYEYKEKFFDTIKRAKEKVEADQEQRALMWESNPTMSIFSLKNNFNWVDKSEVNNTNKNYNKNITDMTDEELDDLINKG